MASFFIPQAFPPNAEETLQNSILSVVGTNSGPAVSAVVAPRLSCQTLYVSGNMFLYGTVMTPLNLGAGVTGLQFSSGTAAAPSVTFTNDNTSGIYLITPGTVGVSSSGVEVAAFGATGLTSIGGADLVLNSSSSNINFSGKNLINVGSISTSVNWFDTAPATQITTSNATPTLLTSIPTVTGSAYSLRAQVTAADDASNAPGAFFMSSYANNSSGTLTIGSPFDTQTAVDPTLAGTSIAFVASGANIVLQVTGLVGTTIKWFGVVRVVRTVY